ncbi:hypothetical protein HMPREF9371_1014 [Neisseria shayeganii 871]|uniref:Uncharacterized protein n=1 Tax=Neisseria shayeganii 871 TaxID=1032488 RepID=G4CHC5_9NEIS|nr:hypothetical protein HMPREF9371_1014 [Neisseria shayeganii 871]
MTANLHQQTVRLGNIKWPCPVRPCSSASSSSVQSAKGIECKGIECARSRFMRLAGVVHIFAYQSISAHSLPLISVLRAKHSSGNIGQQQAAVKLGQLFTRPGQAYGRFLAYSGSLRPLQNPHLRRISALCAATP